MGTPRTSAGRGLPHRPIAWLDGVLGSGDGEKEHGGILSGAQRRYGIDDIKTVRIEDAGLGHGVDEHTAP
jgi:hypothetical protein